MEGKAKLIERPSLAILVLLVDAEPFRGQLDETLRTNSTP